MTTLISKYTPNKIDDLILDDKILDPVILFANGWMQGFPDLTKPAILLHGKPGIGKTLTARTICKECDWNIVEINASYVKSKDSLTKLLDIPSYDFFGRRTCLFLDEIDSPKNKESSGDNIIKKVIMQMRFPVIMCANELMKVSKYLRDVAVPVQFFRPSEKALRQHMLKVNKEEGLCLPTEIIDAAAKTQDYRAAFNILESKQILHVKEKPMSASDMAKNIMNHQPIVFNEITEEKLKKQISNIIYILDENCSKYDILDKFELFETLINVDKYNRRGKTEFAKSLLLNIPQAKEEIENIKTPVYYEKIKNKKGDTI